MPALIIPPGFAQIVYRWQQAGRPNEYYSTIGVALEGGVTDPSLVAENANDALLSAWGATALPTDYVFVGSTAYLGQDGGPPLSGEFLENLTGTSAGNRPSPNCALLISKRTAVGGRRNKGRMYLPAGFMLESDFGSDGRLGTTPLNAFQASANTFFNSLSLEAAIAGPVLFHSTTPSTPTVVTGLQVQSVIATQRERMRR